MKKKQYYCDYCGKECEHTENIMVPEMVPVNAVNKQGIVLIKGGHVLKHVQKDVCVSCQEKINFLLKLMPRVDINHVNPICTKIIL